MATWYSKMIDIEGGQVSVKETHYSVKSTTSLSYLVNVSIKEKIVIYKEIEASRTIQNMQLRW